jgi:hypothetical protein
VIEDDDRDERIQQLKQWAINTFSSELSQSWGGERALKVAFNSLFIQFVVDENMDLSNKIISSTFAGSLVAQIKSCEDSSIASALRKAIGASGIGNAFEFVAHEHILKSNKPYWARELLPKNTTRKRANFKEIHMHGKRKVIIRTIADISQLKDGDYGMSSVPNFPLIDSAIKPNILLNMTISKTHNGATTRLPDIATSINKPINDLYMVFVVPQENLNSFSHVASLIGIQQYVTSSLPTTKDAFKGFFK